MTAVTDGLATAAPDSDLEASERFHRRVAEKLRTAESKSILDVLVPRLRGSMLTWRVALPALAMLVIALAVVVLSRQRPALSPPAPLAERAAIESDSGADLAPTLANYQMVANQSLEKLSELLTRQGNKSLPPAPVYTVSGVEAALR